MLPSIRFAIWDLLPQIFIHFFSLCFCRILGDPYRSYWGWFLNFERDEKIQYHYEDTWGHISHFTLSLSRLSNILYVVKINKYHLLSLSRSSIREKKGNPFKCEFLAREVLTSKNVRLGRNYIIVESNQDVSKIEGIQCFDKNGTEPHKLLVVVEFKEKENVSWAMSSSSSSTLLMLKTFSFHLQSMISHERWRRTEKSHRLINNTGKVISKILRRQRHHHQRMISIIDQFYSGLRSAAR